MAARRMPTTVVGFRLGKSATGRQVTVLVTESGVLHRSHGVYGQPPKLDIPALPFRYLRPDMPWPEGEHVLTAPIQKLRGHHATALKEGTTRSSSRRHACAWMWTNTQGRRPRTRARPHPELTEAFLGSAPHTPQSLDSAVDALRAVLGLPVRPRNVPWRPRPAPVPPQIDAMLRTLAHGSEITSPGRAAVGWSVTPQSVTSTAPLSGYQTRSEPS
ncbi:hypothetical protein [Streptomyces sp. NPDC002082]|uniref:hypothetical protein n=1 Tax=Streptomyces sp. NPDC002082 TaxID=3154772 RepID=UPI003324B74D